MHKIAVATSIANIFLILPTSSLTEIRHWGEVHNYWTASVESPTEVLKSGGRMIFLSKLHINIAHHVVRQIIADIEVLNLAVLAELFE